MKTGFNNIVDPWKPWVDEVDINPKINYKVKLLLTKVKASRENVLVEES